MFSYISLGLLFHLIILSIYLFFKRQGDILSNRFLALFIFADTEAHIAFVLSVIIKNYESFHYLYGLGYSMCLTIGPAIFFYVYTSLGYRIGNFKKVLLHFVPAILAIGFYFYWQLSPMVVQLDIFKKNVNAESPYIYFDILARGHAFIYLLSAIYFAYKDKQRRKEYFSELEKVKFNWIFIFLIVLLIHGLITLPLAAIDQNTYAYYIGIVPFIILNVVTFKVITDPDILEPIYVDKPVKKDYKESVNVDLSVVESLEQYMNSQKVYLQKDLTIQQLADKLNIPRSQLSLIIKHQYKKNFFEFINTYRIEEAKKRLTSLNAQLLKIDTIAEETGFSSRASFYEVFKQYTGTTPSNFRSSGIIKQENSHR